MQKIDLRKHYKTLYNPGGKEVSLVQVPPLNMVMIDGVIEEGHSPGSSPSFQAAMEALYGISYTLKFASKQDKVNPVDYTVMGLEALWWVEGAEFDITNPAGWRWTALIVQPEHISPEAYTAALHQLRRKKPSPALDLARFERFEEGLCMQLLHLGPYADEPRSLARMQAFASENQLVHRGRHHEIYLGDPRRSAPEKLRTILRQPVQPEAAA